MNQKKNRLWECGNLACWARFPSSCGARSVRSVGAAFPQRRLPDMPTVPRRGKSPRVAVNAAQLDLHEADGPVAAFCLDQPHHFATHGFAHEDQITLPANL